MDTIKLYSYRVWCSLRRSFLSIWYILCTTTTLPLASPLKEAYGLYCRNNGGEARTHAVYRGLARILETACFRPFPALIAGGRCMVRNDRSFDS